MKQSPTQVVCTEFELSPKMSVTLSYTPSSGVLDGKQCATLSIGFTDSARQYDTAGGINLTPNEMWNLGGAMRSFVEDHITSSTHYKEGA